MATLGEVLEPTLTTLRNFLGALQQPELCGLGQLHGGRLPAGRLRHDPERLRLEHCAHLANTGETLLLRLPVPAGHGLQLGDVRQRGRQRLRGRHRHLPRHSLAGRLEHGAPGLPQSCTSEPSAGLSPGWCSSRRARWTCTAQIRASAFEGVGLGNGPAGKLAGPHDLGHAGRAYRAGQRGLRLLLSPGLTKGQGLLPRQVLRVPGRRAGHHPGQAAQRAERGRGLRA